MRMSREATAQSKRRILSAASKMVRERGIDATSVANVMQAAGMTNGGFYRHFRSKDELIASAIRAAFDEIADRFDQRLDQNGAAAAISAYVDEYLSSRHIEHPGRGCPVAAAGADAGRRNGAFAEEFIAGAEKLIERLCAGSGGGARSATERAKAIRLMAMLVGAAVMARAAGPGALREEVIAACGTDWEARDRPSAAP
jgi:TetR/AcrR family transcriptional regulator, transcriptional repressor for nem operon